MDSEIKKAIGKGMTCNVEGQRIRCKVEGEQEKDFGELHIFTACCAPPEPPEVKEIQKQNELTVDKEKQ